VCQYINTDETKQQLYTPVVHLSQCRPSLTHIYQNYPIDGELVQPAPHAIAIVDDVLTAGAHFKAAQSILSETYPDVKIYGVFFARRVPDTEELLP
jgi:predicted amidophosphoribosyltransferase